MTKQVLPASVSMLFSAFFPSWLGCPASLTNRVLIVQASGGPFGLVLTRHIWAFKANWSQAKVRVQSVLHNNSDNGTSTTIHYLWSFIKNSNKKVMWDCETSEIIIKHKHPAVHPESIGPSLCKTSSARSCKQKNCCGVARWAANWMLRTLAQNLQLWWLVHRFFVSLPHCLTCYQLQAIEFSCASNSIVFQHHYTISMFRCFRVQHWVQSLYQVI